MFFGNKRKIQRARENIESCLEMGLTKTASELIAYNDLEREYPEIVVLDNIETLRMNSKEKGEDIPEINQILNYYKFLIHKKHNLNRKS